MANRLYTFSAICYDTGTDCMISVKEVLSGTYNSIYRGYINLKVTLSGLGVNLAELDRIQSNKAVKE